MPVFLCLFASSISEWPLYAYVCFTMH